MRLSWPPRRPCDCGRRSTSNPSCWPAAPPPCSSDRSRTRFSGCSDCPAATSRLRPRQLRTRTVCLGGLRNEHARRSRTRRPKLSLSRFQRWPLASYLLGKWLSPCARVILPSGRRGLGVAGRGQLLGPWNQSSFSPWDRKHHLRRWHIPDLVPSVPMTRALKT